MMYARSLLRRPQFVATRLFASRTSPTTVNAARKSADQLLAPESAALPTQNLVKDAIEKMMAVRSYENSKPILDDELETTFLQFQNLIHEAESCIADIREAGENMEEEIQCASSAVDNCFNGFVDLLEDLRRANEQQLEAYNDIRLENARKLKELRKELNAMTTNV